MTKPCKECNKTTGYEYVQYTGTNEIGKRGVNDKLPLDAKEKLTLN